MNVREKLIDYMKSGIKESQVSSLGMEAEHFILKKDTLEAVPYAGEGGIREILCRLMEAVEGSTAMPGKELLGFTAPDYVITLEPAAQLEISINATDDISLIEKTYLEFLDTLKKVLTPYGYTYLAAGKQPVSKVRDLDLIPKERYVLMDRYFALTGTGGIEMMRGTCSVQVSIDYFSAEDFRRKIQAVSYYTPVFKLLMDNAPVFEGRPVQGHLSRTDTWNRTDPKRCGALPGIFKEDYGFGDYADFLLDMPLIFMETKDGNYYTGERTVRDIYENRTPSTEDIIHIQSMAFPDVRAKRYLEIRSADSVPARYATAYCALIKGLLYNKEGLDYAQEQIRVNSLSREDILESEQSLIQLGWDGLVYHKPVREAAAEILRIAKDGLKEEEKHYLAPFEEVSEKGGIAGREE